MFAPIASTPEKRRALFGGAARLVSSEIDDAEGEYAQERKHGRNGLN